MQLLVIVSTKGKHNGSDGRGSLRCDTSAFLYRAQNNRGAYRVHLECQEGLGGTARPIWGSPAHMPVRKSRRLSRYSVTLKTRNKIRQGNLTVSLGHAPEISSCDFYVRNAPTLNPRNLGGGQVLVNLNGDGRLMLSIAAAVSSSSVGERYHTRAVLCVLSAISKAPLIGVQNIDQAPPAQQQRL